MIDTGFRVSDPAGRHRTSPRNSATPSTLKPAQTHQQCNISLTRKLTILLQEHTMSDKKALNILVIGPTGHGGSYLVLELCGRGHHVTGLSRRPETIGTHPKYTPKPFDVVNCSFTELHQTLSGYDVVIKYRSPPPSLAPHASLVQETRRLISQ